MKKQILLMLFALISAVSMMAEDGPSSKQIWYTSNSGKIDNFDTMGATSNEYNDALEVWVATFENDITSIGVSVFADNTSLTSIIIPASVTSICDYAFNGCTSLSTVTFASGSQLATIGDRVFFMNENLTSIIIPASVTEIDMAAFYGCTSLSTVTFAPGSQLKTIGSVAFSLTGITSIEIPASVTGTGVGTFSGCTSLSTVTFASGSQLETIGESAFSSIGITSIEIPASIKSIGENAFTNCTSLSTVTFASGSQLETIGERAFSLTGITSIEIPASVTSIGLYAFFSCSKLTDVTVGWTSKDNLPTMGLYVFVNIADGQGPSGATLHFPAGTKAIYKAAEQWKDFTFDDPMHKFKYTTRDVNPISNTWLNAVIQTEIDGYFVATFFDEITEIPEGAFSENENLTSAILPAGVTNIGDRAFSDCRSLTSITLESITPPTLGVDIFNNCTALTSIIVNNEAVDTYLSSWSEYRSKIAAFDMSPYKTAAITEIKTAQEKVTNLTEDDKDAITSYINTINAATTIEAIQEAKTSALAIIALRSTKNDAITAIENTREKVVDNLTDEDKTAITGYIDAINAATTIEAIQEIKNSALAFITLQSTKNAAIADLQKYVADNHYMNIDLSPYITNIQNATTTDEVKSELNIAKDRITSLFNTEPFTTWGNNENEKKYILTPTQSGYELDESDLVFTDKDLYQSDYDFEVRNGFTYSRMFTNTNWQALYVPFSMSYTDWEGYFDVAAINNFHEYTDENGETVKTELEVRLVKKGWLKPNTPFLIRAKNGSSDPQTISFNKPKEMYESKENSIDCSSTEWKYTFTGTYKEMTGLKTKDCIFMSGGRLCKAENDEVVLSPQRWYLTIEPRGSLIDDIGSYAKARSFDIRVIEDDDATGIDEITVRRTPISEYGKNVPTRDGMFNFTGMRVNDSYKGFVIKNSKKYYKK